MRKTAPQLTQVAKTAKQEKISLTVTKDDVTIVLPVLDEEEGVAAVIDELLEKGYRNILVVDGYSTDSTLQVAREKGVAAVQQHGRGKTGAIQTAIENVQTPYMVVMDGDYTYDATSIPRLLLHVYDYDEIVGARSPENISRIHRLGNRLISSLFNTLFGTIVSDVCSGMYLLNSDSARQLEFRTSGFSVEVEILAQMALNGRVTEVPIHYRKRIGKPKLSTFSHGFDILRSIFGLARRYNPVFVFSIIAALAAVPGVFIITWVLLEWAGTRVLHSGWALAGSMLLLFATQGFIVGTVALLLKRTEIRMERLFRRKTD